MPDGVNGQANNNGGTCLLPPSHFRETRGEVKRGKGIAGVEREGRGVERGERGGKGSGEGGEGKKGDESCTRQWPDCIW